MEGLLIVLVLFVIIIPLVLLILFLVGKTDLSNRLEDLKAENKRITAFLEKLDKKLDTTVSGVIEQPQQEAAVVEPVPDEKPTSETTIKASVHTPKEETTISVAVEDSSEKQTDIVSVTSSDTTDDSLAAVQETAIELSSEIEFASHVSVKKQEKAPKRDLEKFFGINLLSKIGIATLVLGIAYFVKYAIDQNWINEIGRVAIGIFAGGVLIGIAHKLRKTYQTFSSILVGGGISTLYITIMLAFWEYKLFSQTIAFSLLIFITAVSVLLSIAYDKKELAIFSLLGGFASPLMVSSGTGNYIVLFTYFLILNTGMLMLAFKKNWKIVNSIAYGLTVLFYWIWMFRSFEEQYTGAALFALLFFVQFYLLAMIDYFKQKERKITVFQALVILSNNLSFFAASLYIFKGLDINLKGLITMSMALLNAIPLWFVIKDKAVNKQMLYLLVATVLSFVSLAAPVQLDGGAITMFWAAETVIMLLLYQQSSIKIFKAGYFILQVFVIFALLIDWFKGYGTGYSDELSVSTFITGLVVLATLWINKWFVNKQKLNIRLGGNPTLISNILEITIVVLLYFTLLLELRYQLNHYYTSRAFVNEITGLYSCLFLAVYTFVVPKKTHWIQTLYYLLVLFVVWYVSYYLFTIARVRGEVIQETLSGWGSMAIHYFTIPAIIIIFRFLLNNSTLVKWNKNGIYWLITIASIIIVSAEADNILLMCFSNRVPEIVSYSHTIAYPILWGIGSFILMILGMKHKNRNLRIISLSLFALIIAKLYLYDIWKMSQAGRIIAFVFLGLLFLSVSFLYQKLRILFQKDDLDLTQ